MYKVPSGHIEHFGKMLAGWPESTPTAGRFRSYRLLPPEKHDFATPCVELLITICVCYMTWTYPQMLPKDTWYPVTGTRCLVPGAWFLAPGTWHLTPGARHLATDTKCLAPGTWNGTRGKVSGAWCQGTRYVVPCYIIYIYIYNMYYIQYKTYSTICIIY